MDIADNEKIYDITLPEATDVVLPAAKLPAFDNMSQGALSMASALQSYSECIPKIDTSALARTMQSLTDSIPRIDTSMITQAAQSLADSMPKIDTSIFASASTAMAEALSNCESFGRVLPENLDTSGLVTGLVGLDTTGLSALGDVGQQSLLGLSTMVEEQLNFHSLIENIIPAISRLVEPILCFIREHLGDIIEMLRETSMRILEQIYRFLRERFSDVRSAVRAALPAPKRVVLGYNPLDRLRPPEIQCYKRKFLKYVPTIREINLHKCRERGTSSDDAYCFLLV